MLLLTDKIRVEIDERTGSPTALVSPGDRHRMNWIRGDHPFGTVLGFSLLSVECREGGVLATYRAEAQPLLLTVRRRAEGDTYREVYTFRNAGEGEVCAITRTF